MTMTLPAGSTERPAAPGPIPPSDTATTPAAPAAGTAVDQAPERRARGRRLLVIGAHSADFVWRASGTVARHTRLGGEARVIALTYGERGESGELWKEPGQTEERVKRLRHEEALAAAAAVGATFDGLDLGDYPLVVDDEALAALIERIRDFAPHTIITHAAADPFNPDHPVAHATAARARLLATGPGVATAFETVPPSAFLAFEPHQPELCGFTPTTYVDITEDMPAKLRAMEAMAAQAYLREYYTQRADQRGNHARKVSGNPALRQAEAFQRLLPDVTDLL